MSGTSTAKDEDPTVQLPPDRVGLETTAKWLRARVSGETIADSRDAAVLWHGHAVPAYAFPEDDVETRMLEITGKIDTDLGRVETLALQTDERVTTEAAWRQVEPAEGMPDARGYLVLDWDAMDRWFVEDEPAHVHPRDPYHRIDVHESSRHVVVEHAGQRLADSTRPRVLFETGLPPRFYLPKLDVLMEALELSETVTRCAYKGTPDHYHALLEEGRVEDVAWCYPSPNPEHGKVQELVSFYQERVDQVVVDGEEQGNVQTRWSR